MIATAMQHVRIPRDLGHVVAIQVLQEMVPIVPTSMNAQITDMTVMPMLLVLTHKGHGLVPVIQGTQATVLNVQILMNVQKKEMIVIAMPPAQIAQGHGHVLVKLVTQETALIV
jgi:hypothetical protein